LGVGNVPNLAELDPNASTVLIEARPQDTDVSQTRQGAIGKRLLDQGINVLYADFDNPDSFTGDGRALQQASYLEDGRLVAASLPQPVVPDVYRIRDLGKTERPRFTDFMEGYNHPDLSTLTLGRISMLEALKRWGFGASLPETQVITDRRHVDLPDASAFLIKPGATRLRSDVATDQPGKPQRRARYVTREKVQDTISELSLQGAVLLQPAHNIPSTEVFDRLHAVLNPVANLSEQPLHMLRIFHMTNEDDSGTPVVADVRFMHASDVGKQRSPYQLVEPDALFEAAPELGELHTKLAVHIADKYGTNYFAGDYFLTNEGVVINGLHLRAFSPALRPDDLSHRTIDVEVDKLAAMATSV
jgi:hypothetical protein